MILRIENIPCVVVDYFESEWRRAFRVLNVNKIQIFYLLKENGAWFRLNDDISFEDFIESMDDSLNNKYDSWRNLSYYGKNSIASNIFVFE